MAFLILPKIEMCVAKSDILEIVLVEGADVAFSTEVKTLDPADQKGILQVLAISGDGGRRDGAASHVFKRLVEVDVTGQRADGGGKDADDTVQFVWHTDAVAVRDVPFVDFGEEPLEVVCLLFIGLKVEEKGHAAIEKIAVPGLLPVLALSRKKFGKGKRLKVDFVASSAEFRDDVRGKET